MTIMENNWIHRDEWVLQGNNFNVSISRQTTDIEEPFSHCGQQRWYVYAHISYKHSFYDKFTSDALWQDATAMLPLHSGCSYLARVSYNGGRDVIKVGADYNHLYDARFTHYDTVEDAAEVFRDAEELFNFLKDYTEQV